MLMLSRKAGETIIIDKKIRVTVFAVRGSQVRLGIEAPRTMAVDREEIHDRKEAEAESQRLLKDAREAMRAIAAKAGGYACLPLLILILLTGALLSACATCGRHPVVCEAGAAIVAGSLALSLRHGDRTESTIPPHPYHLNKPIHH